MKKISFFAALLLLSVGAKAQSSVQILTNFLSGCSINVKLMAYSGCTLVMTSSSIVISSSGAVTYGLTSPIWSGPTTGLQIKAVEVDNPCGPVLNVGEACTGFSSNATISCSPCFVHTSNCLWTYSSGSTATLQITN